MPTIEIISVNAKSIILDQTDYDLAIIEENKLISHRSLFNSFLKKQKGIIAHIGNPKLKYDDDHCFFAADLIDWDFSYNEIIIPNFDKGETGANQADYFQFLENYKSEVVKIFEKYLNNSPDKKIYFLSDYQFGPDKSLYDKMDIIKFWEIHDKFGLRWNALYELNHESEKQTAHNKA